MYSKYTSTAVAERIQI